LRGKKHQAREKVESLETQIRKNPMLYPLVDDYYKRMKTHFKTEKLVCKRTNNEYYGEKMKHVVRFRCSSRIFMKCPAYFITD